MKFETLTLPTESIASLPQLQLRNSTRQEVLNYFENTWNLTEALFSALEEEAFYRVPYHKLRHPLIFYFAHPAVLYINKLRVAGVLEDPVDPNFERIFEVGVDEMSWDDMSKNDMTWPALQDVIEYRQTVYEIIRNLIETHRDFDASGDGSLQGRPVWALVMGFEHERIHLETSSVLIRELPLKFVKTPPQWPKSQLVGGINPHNSWFKVDSTDVILGKPESIPTFGWDNEYGIRQERVKSFQVSRYLISNHEFLEFVADGGYRDPAYWTETGWRWRRFRNLKWPTFWVPDGPQGLLRFKLRTIFEVVRFQETWPVIVNFHEAQAYCSWKAAQDNAPTPYSLPTEAEYLALRKHAQGKSRWNVGLMFGSEGPVDVHVSPAGVGDVFGNVWQWSKDAFNPLPGFRPHPYYEDFSVPCFDGQHQMIFGGSFISTGDLACQWARYHFRPHFFQHAGFRMCRHSCPEYGSRARLQNRMLAS